MKTYLVKCVVFVLMVFNSSNAILQENAVVQEANKMGSSHLSRKRPLWILNDRKNSRPSAVDHISITTLKPFFKYKSKFRKHKILNHRQYLQSNRIDLPKNYIYPSRYLYNRQVHDAHEVETPPMAMRRQQRIANHNDLPTFDSVPGDENSEDSSMPIFVYSGPKGELILNTMISKRKYPMQEPVPGQILYPPSGPLFRPKPIVEKFRIINDLQIKNLTLIPFYPHEAFDPHYMSSNNNDNNSPEEDISNQLNGETSSSATIFYAASAQPVSPQMKLVADKMAKQGRSKNAKQYAVYRSPNEVRWQPTEPTIFVFSDSPLDTTPSYVLDNPITNHRYGADIEGMQTTATPSRNFKLTYKDEEDNFRIVYVDESLERPMTAKSMPTVAPKYNSKPKSENSIPIKRLSSRYSKEPSNEYYAFPIYTLSKLTQPNYSEQAANAQNAGHSETLFILNSRYKGYGNERRQSSKYVKNVVALKPPVSDEGQMAKELQFKSRFI